MDSVDASLRAVDKHLEENPNDASAWNAKGVFHAQKQEFGEALRSLDRALQLDPDFVPAYTNRGRVLLALGPEKAKDALQSFDRALKHTPDDVQILHDRASALHALGRTVEELSCIQQISKLVPSEWGVWVRVGDIELELGHFESAIKSYETALELKEDVVPAYVRSAIAFGMLERWKEAITSAERATKIEPENSEAWLIRGDVYLKAGRHNSAMKALKKASELDPENETVENTMGMVAYKDGKIKDAVHHLRRAIIRKKDYPTALRNLGLILMELEDWTEASEVIESYTSLVKDNPNMYDALATSYAHLDEFCLAHDAWEKARKLYKKANDDPETERVTMLGRAARINCHKQKKAAKEQREHEKMQRRFSDRHDTRRKKQRKR